MMAELTLLGMSILLIVVVVIRGRRAKGLGFDMLDAHFLMVMFHFSLYTIIDVQQNGAVDVDALVVMWTFTLILTSVLVTWVSYSMLPLRFRRILRFDSMIEQWINVDHKVIVFLATIVILYQIYMYFSFRLLSHFSTTELDLIGVSVPSWVGPVKILVGKIGFSVYIFIVASLAKGRVKIFSLLGAILFVVIIIFALEGRRSIINLVMIAMIVWLCVGRKGLYSLKRIPHAIGIAAVIFLFSNIYQTYRVEVLSIDAINNVGTVTNIIDAGLISDSTFENFKARDATWKFNYMISSKQMDDQSNTLNGTLLFESFLTSIPKFLWESKKTQDEDAIIAKFYGFRLKDYSTTNFAVVQSDFGILMIVIVPIINIITLLLVPFWHFVFVRNRLLFLLASGFSLSYFMNIENSFTDTFLLFRNIFLVTCLVFIFYFLRRIARAVLLSSRLSDTH